MQKKNEKEVLIYMIALLIDYLEELSDVADRPEDQFAYGEKTAYIECLEMLSMWEKADENGLFFDVEQRFPL